MEELTAAAADTVCAWSSQCKSRVTLLYLLRACYKAGHGVEVKARVLHFFHIRGRQLVRRQHEREDGRVRAEEQQLVVKRG